MRAPTVRGGGRNSGLRIKSGGAPLRSPFDLAHGPEPVVRLCSPP